MSLLNDASNNFTNNIFLDRCFRSLIRYLYAIRYIYGKYSQQDRVLQQINQQKKLKMKIPWSPRDYDDLKFLVNWTSYCVIHDLWRIPENPLI